MIDYVLSIVLTVVEMICCKMFFEAFAPKRSQNMLKNCGIFAGMVISAMIVVTLSGDKFIMKQILIVLANMIFMLIYLNISIWKALILALVFQGLLLSVDYLALWLNVSVFHSIEEINESHYIGGCLVTVMGKALLFVIVLIIGKKFGSESTDVLTSNDWLRFIFFPVFTIFTIVAMIDVSGGVENQKQGNVLLVVALCLVGMNVVVFYLIDGIIKREIRIREDRVFRVKVQNQVDMYRSISENFEKQRKMTHEYKNQIICMEAFVAEKKYSELGDYLTKIGGKLNDELDSIKTNNVIVDAVLNSKYREMTDKGITFVFRINDLSGININDEDIVVILANLLNNAIEACDKCAGKKSVKMKFVMEDNIVTISVRNTYNGEIIVKDGEIQTTKKNTDEHGIGLKNIKETVSKYHGAYVIKNDDSEFYFSIIIPVKSTE